MGDLAGTYYYWREESTGQILGRSDSLEFAERVAMKIANRKGRVIEVARGSELLRRCEPEGEDEPGAR